jgi:small subunit ribosomal protein S17
MTEVVKERKMRTLTGKVVSDKMDKTRVILIETQKRHPVFKKSIKRSTRIKIHDEKNESKEGDIIIAVETRPISKEKHYRLIKIMEQAK